MLVDTHCHIHESNYSLDKNEVVTKAQQAGVHKIICVGTDEKSAFEAVEFAENKEGVYASIGIHPHEAKNGLGKTMSLDSKEIVAVGEIGLDYFYSHSSREVQIKIFETQIEEALKRNLPIIFHVREAFDDFWSIFGNFRGIRGVLHSFTDTKHNLDRALAEGLYVGVNGISTFTKDYDQQKMFASIPLSNLLLETDAPFLTPAPFRGKVNEPALVKNVAEFHADKRRISLKALATATSDNAVKLFTL